jgi:polysaccharide biosynthesis protein PslJ
VSSVAEPARERPTIWPSLLALIVLVVLYIPIRRYTLPASLPINLEIYRVVVAIVLLAWVAALLVDPRIRLRRSGLDAPLAFFLMAILLSLAVNAHRVSVVSGDVVKELSFFVSYVLVFYLVVSVIRRRSEIDFLVTFLAGGGATLAVAALVQAATGFNVFDHLTTVMPFLDFHTGEIPRLSRGGGLRAYASAQHPIALGAALCLLLPLAVYLARARHLRRWWVAAGLMALGVLVTRSRTPIVMFGVELFVYVVLRGRDARRLVPALVLALLAASVAVPGSIGTIKNAFLPKGGLVAEQKYSPVGSGRLATLGPALDHEFKPNPLAGEGFGTRVTAPDAIVPVPNAPILDDQWLGVLLETGVVGTTALVWLFFRSFRLMGGAAKRDTSPRGWLLAGTSAAAAGYAAGMFLYDAFSFGQTTFLLLIVLGLGAAAALAPRSDWDPGLGLEDST